jgi:hypothetical protein
MEEYGLARIALVWSKGENWMDVISRGKVRTTVLLFAA